MQLSILDQSPIPEGFTSGDALRNSISLARLANRVGYKRYWVAEHHGTPGLACTSPEVLIGPIAAATSRIRVGSGGVMLPHYSPLKVAENFNMLSGLYPGRIDLGIGRAAGTSPAVARALQRDRRQPAPDDFPDQLDELLRLTGNGEQGKGAQPWLLGSSPQSAIWAAELGLPYVFADFINSDGASIARDYRKRFRPSRYAETPQLGVACWAICADTDEQAMRLSYSFRMMMRLLLRGRLVAVPTVETAERFLEQDTAPSLYPARRVITGTPATVRDALKSLAAEYGADEILIVNIMYDHDARLRSYELIADAFQLSATNFVAVAAQ
jgi:luciferase family oxidoreductase group 1